jgi:hypothetical protein
MLDSKTVTLAVAAAGGFCLAKYLRGNIWRPCSVCRDDKQSIAAQFFGWTHASGAGFTRQSKLPAHVFGKLLKKFAYFTEVERSLPNRSNCFLQNYEL